MENLVGYLENEAAAKAPAMGHNDRDIAPVLQSDRTYCNSMRFFVLTNSGCSSVTKVCQKVIMWKLGVCMCVMVLLLCPSSAHCVPGSEWQMTGGNTHEDVGADSYTTAYLNITYMDHETKRFRTEKSEIGKFGDGRVGPAAGVLVHVSSWEGDHTGCAAPLRSSWGKGALPGEPWIALVKRGQCNFEVKVENAFRHNASAVLVYNDRESPNLDKMKLTSGTSKSSNNRILKSSQSKVVIWLKFLNVVECASSMSCEHNNSCAIRG